MIKCEDDIQQPEVNTAEDELYISFGTEGIDLLEVISQMGNIDIVNSADDSIRIFAKRFVGSQISAEKAAEYLQYLVVGVEITLPKALVEVSWTDNISLDMTARVDLLVEVPVNINISTGLYSGNQIITTNIPKDNRGYIDIYNFQGDVTIYIPISASAVLEVETGDGEIVYSTMTISDLFVVPLGSGKKLTGRLREGLGLIKIINQAGDIYLIETSGLRKD